MTKQQILELERYADLENTEVGEYAALLRRLHDYSYQMEPEFLSALEIELHKILDMFKARTTIVEREITETRKVRELVWDDE